MSTDIEFDTEPGVRLARTVNDLMNIDDSSDPVSLTGISSTIN